MTFAIHPLGLMFVGANNVRPFSVRYAAASTKQEDAAVFPGSQDVVTAAEEETVLTGLLMLHEEAGAPFWHVGEVELVTYYAASGVPLEVAAEVQHL